MPYIDKIKLKSDGTSYDIHDKRIGDDVTSVVPSTRTIATLPLSSNIAAASLVAKLFTITDKSSDDWDPDDE